jgi:pimeloyl-ACP methyl ester carboxylesterase
MRVRVGGLRLFVDTAGTAVVPDGPAMRSRPTILALHGGPGVDHSHLKVHLPELADIAQVVFVDLSGHGRSDNGVPENWTMAGWAAEIAGVCAALDLQRPILYGESFGGMLALFVAGTYPELPAAVIALGAVARIAAANAHAVAAFTRLGGPEAGLAAQRMFDDPTPANQERFEALCLPLYQRRPEDPNVESRYIVSRAVAEHFMRNEEPGLDLRAQIRSIVVPTLVMGGLDDPISPIEDAREVAGSLRPDLGRLVEVPECGHGIAHDAHETWDREVRAFVRQHAPA